MNIKNMLFHWYSFHLYTRLRSLVFVVSDCIDDVGMSCCFWNLLIVTFTVLKIKVECNEPRLEYTKNDYDSFISSILLNRNST